MVAVLPIAAGFDWIEGLVPLLILLFWIIGQVRALFGGGARGRVAAPGAARPPARPAPRPAAADDDVGRELARRIEEFLGRSGDRPAAPVVAAPRDGGRPPARRGGPPARPAPRPASPPAARPTRPLGSLGGHATDVERHVQDAFAHEIEHLPSGLSRPGVTATPGTATAAAVDLAALLRDPATLRQLVIVREVLERPVERW